MKSMSRLIAFLPLVALLVACSSQPRIDAHLAGERIDEQLDKKPMCIEVGKLPLKVFDSGAKNINDLLVSAGLFDRSSLTESYSRYHVYALSALGSPYYRDGKGLCYATLELAEVTSYTAPATSSDGRLLAHVEYTYRAKSVAPWALNEGVQQSFIRIRQVVLSRQTPIKAHATFSYTNHGWRVEDLGIHEVWGQPL